MPLYGKYPVDQKYIKIIMVDVSTYAIFDKSENLSIDELNMLSYQFNSGPRIGHVQFFSATVGQALRTFQYALKFIIFMIRFGV